MRGRRFVGRSGEESLCRDGFLFREAGFCARVGGRREFAGREHEGPLPGAAGLKEGATAEKFDGSETEAAEAETTAKTTKAAHTGEATEATVAGEAAEAPVAAETAKATKAAVAA